MPAVVLRAAARAEAAAVQLGASDVERMAAVSLNPLSNSWRAGL